MIQEPKIDQNIKNEVRTQEGIVIFSRGHLARYARSSVIDLYSRYAWSHMIVFYSQLDMLGHA